MQMAQILSAMINLYRMRPPCFPHFSFFPWNISIGVKNSLPPLEIPTILNPFQSTQRALCVEKLPKTVTLKQMKNDERLQDLALIKQSRLSVTPVKSEEFDIIVGLAHE